MKMKHTVMAAHDSIIAARVKQTKDANKRRRPCPLQKGDLVYISTKNISFPKGLARKFLPKFIGPYLVLEDFRNNSFRIDLPDRMKQRGIHDVFHSSYLRIHVPNDDRLFPGRLDNQVAEFEDQEREWAVEKITSHKGNRSDAVFEVKWKAGDTTWLPYDRVDHLSALQDYFDVLGIENVSELTEGNGAPPMDNPQVFLGGMGLTFSYKDSPSSIYPVSSHCQQPSITSPTSQRPSLTTLTMSSNQHPPLFRALGNARFEIVDRLRRHRSLIVSLDQLRLYLQHDADLRGGADPRSVTIPVGYDQFADVLNANDEQGVRMATVPDDEGIAIEAQGRSPALAQLVGLEAVRREAKPIRDPREEAGGKWLDPRRSELMDEALWDNLERLKKQRKWKERGVAEREAKRQRRDEEEAMRPFSPAGPSLSLNTTGSTRPRPIGTSTPSRADLDPPAPTTPIPAPPPSDHGDDMDLTPTPVADTSQTQAGATKNLARSRVPKK
jgi:hypothetical protein